MKRLVFLLLILCFLSLLIGCDAISMTKWFYSEATLDGDVTSDGTVIVYNNLITIGDTYLNKGRRGFLSFDLSSIKPSFSYQKLLITSAILKVYQNSITNNPYGTLSQVQVEFVDYDTTLNATDYSSTLTPAYAGPFILSSDFAVGMQEVSVTSGLQTAIDYDNYRPQFRLKHYLESSSNGVSDFSTWCSGSHPDHKPTLEVTYKVVDK